MKGTVVLGRPLMMAHRGSLTPHLENSLAGIRECLKEKRVGLIELDIRLSAEGILYCYHGKWWEQLSLHLTHKPWKTVQKCYPTTTPLNEALQLIGSQKPIFLDLKDYAITLPHLLTAVGKTTLKALYIAAGDPFYFKQWKKNWPKSWVRVANRTWQPFPQPKPYLDAQIDIVELMGWNARPRVIERFQKSGLRIGLTSFLCPRRFYKKLCAQKTKPPLPWLLFRHFWGTQ